MNYGFDNIKISSYDELLEYICEEDIMTYYFGDWEPNRHYYCPFKAESTPSFYISYYNESLKWRRFGLYDSPRNPAEFVMIKYNISFYEALTKIYEDIVLGNVTVLDSSVIKAYRQKAIDEISMSIIIKDWEDFDLDYWGQYDGFTVEKLEQFQVNAASEYWSNRIRVHVSTKEDPLYCYNHRHETGKPSFTAYRPYADYPINVHKRKAKYQGVSFKFRKYLIRNHIMNFNTLVSKTEKKRSNVVFVTSSYKDIIALDCIGIDSIAPHTERGIIPETYINELYKYYDDVYIAYDNDSTGVNRSLHLTTTNKKLKYWNVPKTLEGCKDPSDVLKFYDLDTLGSCVKEKLSRDKTLIKVM